MRRPAVRIGAGVSQPRHDDPAAALNQVLSEVIDAVLDVRQAQRRVPETHALHAVLDQLASALKPGGIYLIVDHEAAAGAGASQTSTLHRIEDAVVRSEVEAAGFKLDASSNLLRHPADDHTAKVQEAGIRGKTEV